MFGDDFYLGLFKTEISAGWAYEKKARELSTFHKHQIFPLSDDKMDIMMEKDRLIFKKAKLTSKYPCVYYKKKSGRMINSRWVAIVRENKKNKYLGGFDTEVEANEAVLKYKQL